MQQGPLGGMSDQILKLYMDLMKQRIKDQYRGHQDYDLILGAIDSDTPIVGGEVKVQKEDENGNIYTVGYHVTVKDDLGNFVKSMDELGGQCMKGEICKKGHIFRCRECHGLFCELHVKFVDDDYRKPLCRYGFMDWEGCYSRHHKEYTDGGIKQIQTETKRLNAIADNVQARRRLEAIEKGQVPIEGLEGVVPQKNTGRLGRIWSGSVYSVRCGHCDELITFDDLVCQQCRNVISIDVDGPLICPVCGIAITQVDCPGCAATNIL